MTLSKSETDAAMLNSVSINDIHNDQQDVVIYTRNTSSVHPISCSCEVCKRMKFGTSSASNEIGIKNQLGYFVGDSKQ